MTYVRSDEKQADAVKRILDPVEAYPFEIEVLLADSGFYNERVIRHSREIAATVVLVAFLGDRHEEKLETHKSYMTTYRMYKDTERKLRFPLAVSISYQNGDRGKHGEVVRGYVVCDLGDRTPTQVEHCYRKRSVIESSYRLFRSARAVTSTQDPIVRFAFVVVGFLLKNLWLVTRYRLRIRPDQQVLLSPVSARTHGSMAQYSRARTPISTPTTVGARARSRHRPR